MTKNCLKCNKVFKVKPSHFNRRKFCSVICYYASLNTRVAWNKGLPKENQPRFGKSHSEETRRKIGLGNRGKIMSEEANKKNRLFHLGRKDSLQTRRKKSEALKGSKCHLWKGGITSINESIRKSLEYKLWRKAVFERDGWTCIWCGSKKEIQADHIKPFAFYPDLRFAIDNGRTLCQKCHKTTDTYGRRVKKIV